MNLALEVFGNLKYCRLDSITDWGVLTETPLLWSHPRLDGNKFEMTLRWSPLTRDRVSPDRCNILYFYFAINRLPLSWKEIQQNLRVPEEEEISLTLLLRMLLVFCELPLEESDCS